MNWQNLLVFLAQAFFPILTFKKKGGTESEGC